MAAIVAMVLTLLGILAFDAWTAHVLGNATPHTGQPIADMAGAGSVVASADGKLVSSSIRPGTVVLTFDDGPDPENTPAILDILDRRGVTATFFVIGRNVVDHPGLARRIVDSGHEIANHTFTHPELEAVPSWRRSLELSLTDRAIAGATGVVPIAYRLPYSATAAGMDADQRAAVASLGGNGRIAVFANDPTSDYAAATPQEILRQIDSVDTSQGIVLLLHDGGGPRTATVEALDELITRLRDRGLQITSLSGALGLPSGGIMRPATTFEHISGVAFLWTLAASSWLRRIAPFVMGALIVWSLAKLTADIVMMSLHHRRARRRRVLAAGYSPTVTVIVPAFNEQVGIEAALRAIAASDYRLHEIIVVDDGSTDATSQVVRALRIPNLVLLRQINQGKAAAQNTGLRRATGEIVVFMDADTVFEPHAIGYLVGPFANEHVGAVSGTVRVGNRRSLLGKWQSLEYSYGLMTERAGQDLLGVTWCIPGAIGAYRRDALLGVGGIDTDTMTEDTDTAIRVHLDGWRTVYEPAAVAWTEAPTTLRSLWKQRMRWQFGTFQVMWKHRRQLGRRPWRFGWLMVPYNLVSLVVLPVLSIVADVVPLSLLIVTGFTDMTVLWLVMWALMITTAAVALARQGERLRQLVHLPFQQLFSHWLNIALTARVFHLILTGRLVSWNKLERSGDVLAELRADDIVLDLTDAAINGSGTATIGVSAEGILARFDPLPPPRHVDLIEPELVGLSVCSEPEPIAS
ncbi:MAG: bifunctional polysaccharide deacetylase/glycosyltransferase family 2 protein [Acidimicrobiia bacterium]